MAESVKLNKPEYTSKLQVIFDPEFELPVMAVPLGHETISSNDEGVRKPVVLINKQIILPDLIKLITIDFTGRYPSGTVKVADSERKIAESDAAESNNRIVIAITPPNDMAYKKIKIPGYITDRYTDNSTNTITYQWVYRFVPIESAVTKTYPRSSTMTFFKSIAEDTLLGFAVSDKVAEIIDLQYRLLQGQNIKLAMERYIETAGLSETSIMDYWIDPWGYLNLINIWHQTKELDKELEIKADAGSLGNVTSVPAEVETVLAFGALTNLSMRRESNLHIKSYRAIVDNNVTQMEGNSTTFQFLHAEGAGGSNNIITKDVQVRGNNLDSLDASKNEFHKFKFGGVEQSSDGSLMLKTLHTNFLKKFKLNMLEVEMTRPNFGLARGCLINVLIVNYASNRKMKGAMHAEDIIDPTEEPQINTQYTGVYYIQGMKFIYNDGGADIRQFLYLIPISAQIQAADYHPQHAEGLVSKVSDDPIRFLLSTSQDPDNRHSSTANEPTIISND